MKDDRDWILERLGADETPATPPPAAPSLPAPSHLRDGFIERATANSAQVVSLPTLEELPQAVADYLWRNDLPATAVCEDSLLALPWRQAAVAVEARAPNASDICGVTRVPLAAADTGAMLQTDEVANALTLSLLPPHHVAVLAASDIVPTMAHLFARLRPPLPRGCSLLCGPSRTADIEQTLTLGVHGPLAVLVALIEDGRPPAG